MRVPLLLFFRGVYRVGHTAPSLEAHYLAAVKACGDGALLSGPAAAHLLGLRKGAAPAAEVAAPSKRRVKGVTIRRAQRQATLWRGVPVTSLAETLDDLARCPNRRRAGPRLPPSRRAPPHNAKTGRGGPGPTAQRPRRAPATQSAARRRQRHPQHARARLSRPAAPPRPAPTEDKPARRRATAGLHTRHAWEQDRHREREAHARGHDFRRYTYADVLENPALMLAELTALLSSARSALPSPR